jgi:signal transduction histidine kinase
MGRWLLPAAVALLGCVVTLAAFLVVKSQAVREQQRDFAWVVQELSHDLEARLQLIFAHHMGIAEALSRLPPRQQNDFDGIVGALKPSCGTPCIRGIGYFPRVPAESLGRWQKAVRAAAPLGSPQATLTVARTARLGEEVFPALMVSPLKGNRHILGMDLMAIEGHRENLLRLLRHGDSVGLTKPLRFDLATYGGRPAVLLAAPVYADGAPIDTVDQRQRALQGLVLAGLGVEGVLADAMPATKRPNVEVQVFDQGSVDAPPQEPSRAGLLLDTVTPLTQESQHPIPGPDFAQAPLHDAKLMDFGGRRWGLYVERTPLPLYQTHASVLMVPLFGLALTGLAVLLALRSQRTSDRLEAEVVLRTADLRRSNRNLNLAMADIERSQEDLRCYAKLAAHDLSEPSRGIVSFAQLLGRHLERSNALDADSDDYLRHLEQAARQMRRTVDGFATYTQVVAAMLHETPVLGERLRDNILDRLASNGDGGLGANYLAAHVEWGAIPDLICDASRVEEALFHVVRNALTFVAPNRPAQVRVSGAVFGPWWVLEVQDNGLGIPREDLERLTEPFARGNKARAFDSDLGPECGPGIGLAISRRVAERHGGRLELEPGPDGEGTVVRLILPRHGTKARLAEVEAEAEAEAEGIQGENCSLRMRSSRLCSGSNSNVREMRLRSLISTRATSRTSV